MAKRIFKYIGKFMAYFLICSVGFPLVGGGDPITTYSDPGHWRFCLVISLVGTILEALVRNNIIRIPTFYFCSGILPIVATILTFFAFMVSLFVILWNFESAAIQVVFIILTLVICAFVIGATWCRGVAVYEDGTVKIFKFRVKTYKDAVIDDIKIEYNGIKCKIIVTVNGEDNVFNAFAVTGKLCGKRLMELSEEERTTYVDR